MVENNIELKSVQDLFGMEFHIPNYQRGYRWTEQQVKDLLNDIWEFHKKEKSETEFYCLQPLVVKKRLENEQEILNKIKEAEDINGVKSILDSLKGSWDVIDGQQRLTTIFIILSVLKQENKYTLEYETREKSKEFLNNINKEEINKEESNDNIDFFHIYQAKKVAKDWFKGNKKAIKDTLLNKVKFIWYETVEEDPIKVFTRLNIGKIPLTNSELIKALLLNSSNFKSENPNHLRLKQQEIASEWDNIEYTLQNDEFWLFLHSPNYDKPTRIDFIFDLIVEKKSLGLDKNNTIGTDNYKTFRYFNIFLSEKNEEKITQCWSEVKKYFQTFQEWFNDLEMYHYVGFLIDQGKNLKYLYDKWEGNKQKFIEELKGEIKGKIEIKEEIKKLNSEEKIKDILEIPYDIKNDIESYPPKTKCKPILLFHNIYTVIKQNSKLENDDKYGLKVFYKFPFHLYKKEKWDVEHINSNTENNLEDEKDQKEWLRYSLLALEKSDVEDDITKFLNNDNDKKTFDELYTTIETKIGGENEEWDEYSKNQIWNFVLLDAGTNRGYGNAIFPAKRRTIIEKESGKKLKKDGTGFEDGAIAFVPPVTKNVFLKYYTKNINSLTMWTQQDAGDYKENIREALKFIGIKEQENN
jgi:uncharacterized protein with ParB-like and HNH nuclease domain